MNIIHISNIKVKDINLCNASWLISDPIITAVDGFVHNLSLKTELEPIGFSILHHNIDMDGEKYPNSIKFYNRRAATFINDIDYASNSNNLANQPLAKANLTFSLFIYCEEFIENPDIEKVLKFGRIGGGIIEKYDDINYEMESFENERILNGFWLVDRHDLMESKLNEFKDLNQLEILSMLNSENKKIVPKMVGYTLISELKDGKENVRLPDNQDSCKHAYCEPLVGIVEYVHNIETIDGKVKKVIPENLMWSSKWIDSSYILTNNV